MSVRETKKSNSLQLLRRLTTSSVPYTLLGPLVVERSMYQKHTNCSFMRLVRRHASDAVENSPSAAVMNAQNQATDVMILHSGGWISNVTFRNVVILTSRVRRLFMLYTLRALPN